MFEIPMSLRLDDDGLLRKECPFCEQQFKIFPEDELSFKEKYYCPMCGLSTSSDQFFTKDQITKAIDLSSNFMVDQINKGFGKVKNNFRGSKNVSFQFKPLPKKEPKTLVEISDFEHLIFSCCNSHSFVFAPLTYKVLYCHHCGEINFPK